MAKNLGLGHLAVKVTTSSLMAILKSFFDKKQWGKVIFSSLSLKVFS